MARAYFVTGTDTGVGKTLVASALLNAWAQQGLRSAALKPVAAGATWQDGAWHNEDLSMLRSAASVDLPQALLCPYLLQAAVAPHLAARAEQVEIREQVILDAFAEIGKRADRAVVEGVGGFRVPLGSGFDSADLAQTLALPVILVVGLRLGCLNHALLTAEAIAARGLQLAGWVANTVDAQMPFATENIETLREALAAPLLGTIPRLAQDDPGQLIAAAAACLDLQLLPN